MFQTTTHEGKVSVWKLEELPSVDSVVKALRTKKIKLSVLEGTECTVVGKVVIGDRDFAIVNIRLVGAGDTWSDVILEATLDNEVVFPFLSTSQFTELPSLR